MNSERKLLVQRLGLTDYASGLALQQETEQAVKLRTRPDTLLLLEHPHTLTIGRRGDSSAVLLDAEQLQKRNVTMFETNRGGKVTYHGLGQLVGYPIVNLSPDREDVHRYMRDLEEVLMRDVQFSAAFATAIEQKQIAQQNAQRMQYVLQKAEKLKQQKILEAQGDARSIQLRGRAIAQNARIVQYEYARKVAPNVSAIITDGRNVTVPFAAAPSGGTGR
jgi:hypothetical protein